MMREKTKRLLFRKSKMQIVAKTSKKLKSQFRQELFKGQRAEDKRYFGQTSLRSSRWLLRSEKSRSDENWEEIKLLLMIVFLSESPWKSNEKEISLSFNVFWKVFFYFGLNRSTKDCWNYGKSEVKGSNSGRNPWRNPLSPYQEESWPKKPQHRWSNGPQSGQQVSGKSKCYLNVQKILKRFRQRARIVVMNCEMIKASEFLISSKNFFLASADAEKTILFRLATLETWQPPFQTAICQVKAKNWSRQKF